MMPHQTRTISVTSGKGGVGKTSLVCNLAAELARQGKRVLILDGDLGMANVDIQFGVRTRANIGHVIDGRCPLTEILTPVAPNITLIPGGSGVYGLSQLAPAIKQNLLDQISALEQHYDFLLIDTAPGIDDNVLYMNAAAQEIMVMVTPDPSALTDAYALIKVLNQRYRESHFSIVANMVKDEAEARQVFQKLSDVASRFLCVGLELRGFIPMDLNLRQSVRSQSLVVQTQSQSPASLAIRSLGRQLCLTERSPDLKGGMQFFWNQISGLG